MEPRLPAHLEVAALLRQVQAAGGFAAVLQKGERDAGTLLVVCCRNGVQRSIFERLPSVDGTRAWSLSRTETLENKAEINQFLAKRSAQDPDLWAIELDIPNAERFIGLTGTNG